MLFKIGTRVIIGNQSNKDIFRIIGYDDTAVYANLKYDGFDYVENENITIHECFLIEAPPLQYAEQSESESESEQELKTLSYVNPSNSESENENKDVDMNNNIDSNTDICIDSKNKFIKLYHSGNNIDDDDDIFIRMKKIKNKGIQMLINTKLDYSNGIIPSKNKIEEIIELMQGTIYDPISKQVFGMNLSEEEMEEIDSLSLPLILYGNNIKNNDCISTTLKRKYEN